MDCVIVMKRKIYTLFYGNLFKRIFKSICVRQLMYYEISYSRNEDNTCFTICNWFSRRISSSRGNLFHDFLQGCVLFSTFQWCKMHCSWTIRFVYVYAAYDKPLKHYINDINQEIIDGTDLYRYITHTSGQNEYLSHRDLPTNLQEWNEQCK